ncbi:MAG: metal-dependent hydrolase [Acidobacteria bacterium]|nr:metal-dependent hydrolase [Acidobacteriota bacterium]
MPTIFAHAVIGSAIAKLAARETIHPRTVIACSLLAILPDVDGLFFGRIPYAHLFGHRGLTHSLLFAVIAGLLTALFFIWRGWIQRVEWLVYSLLFARATASHGVLDAFTNGGLGVAFFAPFNPTRYFFPYRPIPVSPMTGAGLLTARGWRVIAGELLLLWTFAAAVWLWKRDSVWRCVWSVIGALIGVWAWLA